MNKLKEELQGEPLWDLPRQLSDELITTYEILPIRWLGHWLFIIIMIGGFGIGIFLWIWCDALLTRNALEAAKSVNGFAYDSNFGIGLLIGLFVWIFMSWLICLILIRITPMPYKGTLFLASQTDTRRNNGSIIPKKPKLGSIRIGQSVSQIINTYLNRFIPKSFLSLAPFILAVGFITNAELDKFSILSPSGFHESGLFAKDLSMTSWQQVEEVKLGCNQTDDGASFIYEVVWPNGKKSRLPTDTHINGENWLTNLELVDAEISKGRASFVRWEWLNRDALHPKCLRSFYASQDNGGKERIDRLLRIGQLSN